ncbi:MAG: 16S rRNA (cytidine(1402)-2'-O)-methyltransferase [Lachnospiraceae bacterium]|nr:16S rRNA (cytidine(1402)-2'-O)-methyltransferase [Lachnospiraceae bacterium]
MAGTLYLCATPIGNLEDITFRVVRTLKEVDLIAAEDTRHSIKLLNHLGIKTSMTSYHEYNKVEKAKYLVRELIEGKNIALITDAGTPGISDPGEELVRQCYEAGITVTSLPGPAACITALTMSGLPTRRFAFEAFLPADKKEREQILKELQNETRTMILYEAPHHLKNTVKELYGTLGDRRITVLKELTKRFESGRQYTLSELANVLESEEPRGEYVLVIEGKPFSAIREEQIEQWSAMSIEEHMTYYESQGIARKEAMKLVAKDRGVSKRDIYQELLKIFQGEFDRSER